MKDAQRPDHISLQSLINRLIAGRFVIPDFQREFEWYPQDVGSLIQSIFYDYYIGSLLLWKSKTENFSALACENIEGFKGENGNPEHIVLDGQQRLTAMHYAFVAPEVPFPGRKQRCLYFLYIKKFQEDIPEETVIHYWGKRGLNLLDNREEQYQSHILPLSILGISWEISKWIEGYKQYWSKQVEIADGSNDADAIKEAQRNYDISHKFGEYIRGLIEEYQIAYIELDKDIAVDKVCDIFTQINSKGMRLNAFDLINALLKPKGLQLKLMWREAKPRLKYLDDDDAHIHVLQVMSILTQNYCSPKYLYYLVPDTVKVVKDEYGGRQKIILIQNADEFESLWNTAVSSIEAAIHRLQRPDEFGAITSAYLPYKTILPVFASLLEHIGSIDSSKQIEAKEKFRLWYWSSIFTNRYSSAAMSTSAKDYIDIKNWIEDTENEPRLIEEFKISLRALNLQHETTKNSAIYKGIFNLLVKQGAVDWITGNAPFQDDLDDHHIVPASWCSRELNGPIQDSVLNRTLLTSNTNRHIIKDRLPCEYLLDLIESNGKEKALAILDSHMISPEAVEVLLRNPFTPEDFNEFIGLRQDTMINGIQDLLIGKRVDLSPGNKELQGQIETIELALRDLINVALDGSVDRIPSHLLSNAEKLIERRIKKNPSLDGEHYRTLNGKLEFFNITDLELVITNKTNWQCFENLFASTGTVKAKFSQLAELRNCFSHSRSVDPVTKKDGEASILWFKNTLLKSTS